MIMGFVAVVIWRIHSSRHPVDAATVYAGDLAAVAIGITLVTALFGWWFRGRRQDAPGTVTPEQCVAGADRLAILTSAMWRDEAVRRGIITPAPAAVRWRWESGQVADSRSLMTRPPLAGTGPAPFPDPGQPGVLLGSGVVTRLHGEVYAKLPHGRLVLLGEPGAGKTGAMVLLLLAALDHRASLPQEQRAPIPVPVWLTLAEWDPSTTPLKEWAVATVDRDYPALSAPDYGPDVVAELLRRGGLALFLDGLDETPSGVRARALKRIKKRQPEYALFSPAGQRSIGSQQRRAV